VTDGGGEKILWGPACGSNGVPGLQNALEQSKYLMTLTLYFED
jgi:hypothetical protein